MTKPISDKAEVALEYPDKLYVGTFERSSRFEAHIDPNGIALILERPGAEDVRKSLHMHINFGLFADILRELASTVGRLPKDDVLHRDQLAQAVTALHKALRAVTPQKNHQEIDAIGPLRRQIGCVGYIIPAQLRVLVVRRPKNPPPACEERSRGAGSRTGSEKKGPEEIPGLRHFC